MIFLVHAQGNHAGNLVSGLKGLQLPWLASSSIICIYEPFWRAATGKYVICHRCVFICFIQFLVRKVHQFNLELKLEEINSRKQLN